MPPHMKGASVSDLLKKCIATSLTLGLFLSSGCNRNPKGSGAASSPTKVAQVLIDSDGTYLLDPGDYKLVVSLQPDGGGHLVAYELREPVADAVVASGDAGGNASRWFFYWSVDQELWVHSSDVGTFVWRKQSGAGYQRHLVTDDATIRGMPAAVFDALPDSLKRRWSAKRDPTP